MVPFRFRLGLAALLGGGLVLLTAPTHAQPYPYTYAQPFTSAGPVAAGPLSGYSGKFPTPLPPSAAAVNATTPVTTTLTPAAPVTATLRTATAPVSPGFQTVLTTGAGPTTANGYTYYTSTDYEAYSPVYESPGIFTASRGIFMTSIHYPGLYGAFFYDVPSVAYNVRPSARNWQTISTTEVLPPRTDTITPVTRAVPEVVPAAEPGTTALLNVYVQPEAALSIQGIRMNKPGAFRQFVSPPLVPGEDYTYSLRAVWNKDGQEMVRKAVVQVRGGQTVSVDLMAPTQAQPAPTTMRAQPLPPLSREPEPLPEQEPTPLRTKPQPNK
jgi:uncharacterized protein (TIGR03000 family)